MMQFDEFAAALQAAVPVVEGSTTVADANSVRWAARTREAVVTLVPPLNVSVALHDSAAQPVTTWYPVDPALVPTVSQRVAGFLSEA